MARDIAGRASERKGGDSRGAMSESVVRLESVEAFRIALTLSNLAHVHIGTFWDRDARLVDRLAGAEHDARETCRPVSPKPLPQGGRWQPSRRLRSRDRSRCASSIGPSSDTSSLWRAGVGNSSLIPIAMRATFDQ